MTYHDRPAAFLIDWDKVKDAISGIAIADHMGDVNSELPDLLDALGLPRPDEFNHRHMRWGPFKWETCDVYDTGREWPDKDYRGNPITTNFCPKTIGECTEHTDGDRDASD